MNQYVNDFNTTVKTYYKELKQYNSISREEEKELILQAKQNNIGARNKILSAHLKFVFNVAKNYSGYGASLDELIGEGNVGLTKAIDKFDETRDIKFITYAVWWIRQAIQDYLKKRQQVESIEIRDEMNEIVYDNAITDEEDERIIKIEVISSNEEEEKNKEVEQTQRKVISKLLVKLTSRERKIIECYYGLDNNDEMNLEEIGEIMNISKERVRQIKASAFKKLRSEILLVNEFNYLFKS